MGFFKTWISDGPVDLKRRSFIFGVAASAAIVAAPKSFFIIEPPRLIVPQLAPLKLAFDLPPYWAERLLKRLNDQLVEVSGIPRWVVTNKADYDIMVAVYEADKQARR